MAYGYYLEAEYADGFVHRETDNDQSPYVAGKNTFNDILEKRPCAEHGDMVRFSLIGTQKRYDIDWTGLHDNARPIYYRKMQLERNVSTGEQIITCQKHVFGYQFTNDAGANDQVIEEI